VEPWLKGVAEWYAGCLRKFGTTARGVDWKDDASHLLRFDKLLYLLDGEPVEPFSVNDFGCGYGALFRVLDKRFPGRVTRYHGYDISAEMVEAAAAYVDSERAQFVQSERILHRADYSFASGVFNVKQEVGDEVWKAYIEDVLRNLHETSAKGFAFNALTNSVDFRAGHLYYADPMYFFTLCRERFSTRVTLLHDYPLFEWTMIVRT
jgi:SAM-dependent methyltransferase